MSCHHFFKFQAPVCAICGETAIGVIEFHHVGGVRVALCCCCHRKLLASAENPPSFVWDPPDELETVGHALLAEGDLLAIIAQTLTEFGHVLINRVKKEVPDELEGEF